MNHNHVRNPHHVIERVPHRVLPPLAAFDDHDRLLARAQIVRRRCSQVRRQRNDDVSDGVGMNEGVDTVLEDRTARECGQLLRLIGPKPESAPTRGDDG
jgi:hypothetical protein